MAIMCEVCGKSNPNRAVMIEEVFTTATKTEGMLDIWVGIDCRCYLNFSIDQLLTIAEGKEEEDD